MGEVLRIPLPFLIKHIMKSTFSILDRQESDAIIPQGVIVDFDSRKNLYDFSLAFSKGKPEAIDDTDYYRTIGFWKIKTLKVK